MASGVTSSVSSAIGTEISTLARRPGECDLNTHAHEYGDLDVMTTTVERMAGWLSVRQYGLCSSAWRVARSR
jgi:hypothetical protein